MLFTIADELINTLEKGNYTVLGFQDEQNKQEVEERLEQFRKELIIDKLTGENSPELFEIFTGKRMIPVVKTIIKTLEDKNYDLAKFTGMILSRYLDQWSINCLQDEDLDEEFRVELINLCVFAQKQNLDFTFVRGIIDFLMVN